jgi:hypothetical protein
MKKFICPLLLIICFSTLTSPAQSERWQQSVSYKMEVDMDVNTNQYKGNQVIAYTNNSPDTLHRVFFHLYYNAFQPNSMMDIRSRTIADPDRRVGDRISKLSPEEIGYMRIQKLTMNGLPIAYEEVETVLEGNLPQPILPHTTVLFETSFEGQVPLQVRRAGRDSEEGIRYSMSQWYPKISNYDEHGWHANPYIGREFYGIWGDFDVRISIDKTYTLGGTGYLQNNNEIGHGYEDKGVKVPEPQGEKLTWHFHAPRVHDFMWAADPNYTHDRIEMENGITIHHLYIKNSRTASNWEKLKSYTPAALSYMSEHFGEYPYKQFSVIQGGDGGMEYPMSTLITGHRTLGSLVGVMVHELVHSWYHGVLGNNESLYPWMDEGFTSYASSLTMANIFSEEPSDNPHRGSIASYERLVESGLEEPLATHADHFHTNVAYGAAAYSKGALFLVQLGYIIGEDNLSKAMLRYYYDWKFRHPNPNDVIRVMEKVSGLELDWFKEYWVYTTKTIDYAVKSVEPDGDKTKIILERKGLMPMPLDVVVTYQDDSKATLYFPLVIQRGEKPQEEGKPERVHTERWPWVETEKSITIDTPLSQIKSVEIDPSGRMADINRDNNKKEF